MKKIFRNLFIFAAAIAAASCGQELKPVQSATGLSKGEALVSFGAETDKPTTKVSIGTDDDLTFKSSWVEDVDKMWIDYLWETDDDIYGGAILSNAWNGTSFTATMSVPKVGEEEVAANWVYTCYYPQSTVEEGSSNVFYSFGANREQQTANYNGAYDLMYCSKETTNSKACKDGDKDVIFNMKRLTSLVYFHITTEDFDASEKLKCATLVILEDVDNGVDAGDVIIASDQVYLGQDNEENRCIYAYGAGQSNSITLTTEQDMADFKLWFNVIPVVFSKAQLVLTTSSGRSLTLNMGKDDRLFEYVAGGLNKSVIGPIPASAFKKPEPPAPTEPTYTLAFTQLTSASSYTAKHDYEYDGVDWSIFGNQSLSGNILRIGGKNIIATDRTITSTSKISGEVSYIVINHAGLTNGKESQITVNSFSIEASTDPGFTAETTEKVTITDFSVSDAGDLNIAFEDSHKDSFYRITMNCTITGSNNCYLTIKNIEFWLGAVIPKYDVTISDDIVGGEVTATPTRAKVGETVCLSPVPDNGYDFTSWNVTCSNRPVEVSEDNTFVMPEGDVVVSAIFTAKPKYKISITQPTVGGEIRASHTEAWEGQEVTLTPVAVTDYALSSWNVTYGSEKTPVEINDNKFIMPAGNVEVTATFEIVYRLTVSPMKPVKETSSNGSQAFTVSTNTTDWTASVPNDQSWASVNKKNATSFSVAYTANESETETTLERSVVITVASEQAGLTGEKAIKITLTQAGKEYIAPGTGYKLVTDISELSAGMVIVLGCASQNKVAGALGSNTYLLSQDAKIKDGVLTANNVIEFTLGGSTDKWTLTSIEGTLGATADKKLAVNTGTTTWTIAIENSNAAIASTNTSYGKIQYNSVNPRFLNYASSQTAIQIYAKDDGLESRHLEFLSDKDTKDMKDGVSISALDLNGAIEGTKTYKSSDELVATITDDGIITLLKAGTTIISVHIDPTETYRAGSASYELEVIDTRETCAEPVADPPAGEVSEGTQVTLSCSTDNSTIFYRIGTTGNFVPYSSGITIDEPKTIYAYAKAEGYKQSATKMFSYKVAGVVKLAQPEEFIYDSATKTIKWNKVTTDVNNNAIAGYTVRYNLYIDENLVSASPLTETEYTLTESEVSAGRHTAKVIAVGNGNEYIDSDETVLSGGFDVTYAKYYVKVTSELSDWRGSYIIVYETGTDAYAFDGSLSTLDAVKNYKVVDVSGSKIEATDDIKAIQFVVDYKGESTTVYNLKSASDKYISGTTVTAAAANKISQADRDTNYEITFGIENNNAMVYSQSKDMKMQLKYNSASDQNRFRFYKTGQQAISLYKLEN